MRRNAQIRVITTYTKNKIKWQRNERNTKTNIYKLRNKDAAATKKDSWYKTGKCGNKRYNIVKKYVV